MVVEPPEPGPQGAPEPGPDPGTGSRLGRSAVVVDVANVVGSRPDGWWRDRPAATARLLAGLAHLAERGIPPGAVQEPAAPSAGWHVVLEGVVRDLPVPGPLIAVRARSDGDAAVVTRVRSLLDAGVPEVLVVTADRGLRARLPSAVKLLGPVALRNLLDQWPERGTR